MGGGVQGNGEGAGPSAERDGGSSAATSHWPGREPAGAAIGPSQVELSALPPWARVKRVVMHYVRFFRAFSVLRNMHVPLELDTTLLAKKENLGGARRCPRVPHPLWNICRSSALHVYPYPGTQGATTVINWYNCAQCGDLGDKPPVPFSFGVHSTHSSAQHSPKNHGYSGGI